jgi:hypothetical protein
LSLTFVRLSDITPSKITWIWKGRLAAGTFTVGDGDPDACKSHICIDLAARITRGDQMPDDPTGPRSPGDVVFLAAEDPIAEVLLPRFRAAGGVLTRLHVLKEYSDPPLSREGLRDIEALCKKTDARLLVIDPLMSYLPDGTDAYSDHHVRKVLQPLAEACARTRTACLAVRHFGKDAMRSEANRGVGSVGIRAVARTSLVVKFDRKKNEGELKVSKCNLAPREPSLRYRLVPSAADPDVAVVEWLGAAATDTATPPSDETFMRDLMAFVRTKPAGFPNRTALVRDFHRNNKRTYAAIAQAVAQGLLIEDASDVIRAAPPT